MTISTGLYRLWREAATLGLTITPAPGGPDHAYIVSGPRLQDSAQLIISDLQGWLAEWLAGYYADPGTRELAAAEALAEYVDPLEWAARAFEQQQPGD